MTQTQLTFFSDTEQYAAALAENPDFRVLRRLVPRNVFREADGRALAKGIIIDTETTGLVAGQDKIIELAMLAFDYDAATGEVFRVTDTYNGFEDPGEPIAPESTAVHGITDEMVAGQHFDDARIAAFAEGADIIIAHNARFDRQFLEVRLPVFADHAWGCSFAQVDWNAGGIASAKLEFIAYRLGFFYDAHRALTDCVALLEALQGVMPGNQVRPLASILATYRKQDYRVWARGSRFDTKDTLKARGYRWEGDEKCWYRTVDEDGLALELDWLKAAVYNGRPSEIEIEAFDAMVRFSARAGLKEMRRI